MDYSSNECMYEWTQGQVDVMHANLEYYRQGGGVPSQAETVQLDLGEYSEEFSMLEGESREFFVNVPSTSDLLCKLAADNGDVDLALVWDAGSSNCLSRLGGSNDACIIASGTGRANILVSAFYTTFNFTIYCNSVARNTELEVAVGALKTGINVAEGTLQPYSIRFGGLSFLESVGTLDCWTNSTGSADVDLFIRMGSIAPGLSASFDCISALQGSAAERCGLFPLVNSTSYYAFVFSADTSPADIELGCNVLPLAATELTSGVQSAEYDIYQGQELYFYLNVTSVSTVACNLEGDTGDADLYMGWDHPKVDLLCESESETSVESCSIDAATGVAFASVIGYRESADITITCNVDY